MRRTLLASQAGNSTFPNKTLEPYPKPLVHTFRATTTQNMVCWGNTGNTAGRATVFYVWLKPPCSLLNTEEVIEGRI